MPEQGSGPLRHTRGDLMKWLDAYGVKRGDRAEALRVLEGVRGVVIADDVSYLAKPVAVPVALYGATQGAIAGQNSFVEVVSAPGRGCWILDAVNTTGNFQMWSTESLPAIATGPTVVNPAVNPSEIPNVDHQVIVRTGGAVGVGTPIYTQLATSPASFVPLYLAPGRIIRCSTIAVATACQLMLKIQEVP